MLRHWSICVKIPVAVSFTVGLVGAIIWALLMVLSIAFVIYDQSLSFSDDNFVIYFMIKYYPLVVLGLFLIALKFKDDKGIFPFLAVTLPSLLLIYLVYDMARVSIIDWDNFESPEQKQFVYEAAFGSSESLDRLLPAVESVNFTGEVGLTPLLAAYKGRNKETFYYLLEKNANVNLMPNGSLSYNVANYIISDYDHDSNSQEYFEALTNVGLDINIATELSNLVQSATKSENQWYLHYLIENGVNANRRGVGFLTPLGTSTLHRQWDNALYLLAFSHQESLEEAAGIYYDHNERGFYMIADATRSRFEQALVHKGIDFKKAFEKKETDRQQRLDNTQNTN